MSERISVWRLGGLGVAMAAARLFRKSSQGLVTIAIAAIAAGCGGGGGGSSPPPPAADAIAPSIPTAVSLEALPGKLINITWAASSDNMGVSGYDVYRDGQVVGSTTGTTYADSGVDPDVDYCYTIAARDAAGNSSGQSADGNCATGLAALNFVVIFTDDQRRDTLSYMPILQDKLFSRGVTFNNAFVPTPSCMTSRASTYAGGFLAQNTGVIENNAPNGGFSRFNDTESLGTVLQDAGYETMFIGKYLNDYNQSAPYVPPGWSRFVGRASYATSTDWNSFRYTTGSSTSTQSSMGTVQRTGGKYTTYYERDEVLDFIDGVDTDDPFFVFFSTTSPHATATPAAGDESLFGTMKYNARGVKESNFNDKPSWVKNYNGHMSDIKFIRNQLRTLQSVDRSVGEIIDKIESRGQMDNTVFIYTSDNGFLWGEHSIWGKGKPYEESLSVPFVITMPGVAPRADEALVSANLDIGPTLYELANVDRQTDGRSLVSVVKDSNAPSREYLFHESFGSQIGGYGAWVALRNDQWKYIEHANGENELYDLRNDPFELASKHSNPAFASIKQQMADEVDSRKALTIVPLNFINSSRVGKPYEKQLETWGAQGPMTWSVHTGRLPDGLTLDPATGIISGIPTTQEEQLLTFKVVGSALGAHSGQPRSHITRNVKFKVYL